MDIRKPKEKWCLNWKSEGLLRSLNGQCRNWDLGRGVHLPCKSPEERTGKEKKCSCGWKPQTRYLSRVALPSSRQSGDMCTFCLWGGSTLRLWGASRKKVEIGQSPWIYSFKRLVQLWKKVVWKGVQVPVRKPLIVTLESAQRQHAVPAGKSESMWRVSRLFMCSSSHNTTVYLRSSI